MQLFLPYLCVLEIDACHFIKSDAIPKTDKPHRMPSHVIKKVGNRSLPAGYKDTVRRYLFIDM